MAFGVGYLKWPGVVQTKISLPSLISPTGAQHLQRLWKKFPFSELGVWHELFLWKNCYHHLSHDACPFWELCLAAWLFCMGLGGWEGRMLRTSGSLCQNGQGRWSSTWGQVTSLFFLCLCHPLSRTARREQLNIVIGAAGGTLFVWLWHSVLSRIGQNGCEVLVCGLWLKQEKLQCISSSVPNASPGSAVFWSIQLPPAPRWQIQCNQSWICFHSK